MARKAPRQPTRITTLKHGEATRKNIPTAEFESVVEIAEKAPIRVAIDRRNRDLDPQLVWRGKDRQDASDLVVSAPPLYIQEKVHPKALIDDLLRSSRERAYEDGATMPDLFADFNGIPKGVDKTDFYQHDQNWSNRLILGDSLQVMASLAEREGLRGKVQCIYVDPPYGIKFNSNFQWSTTSAKVTDGNIDHITREPEQVKAFRDTWRDGVHSYLGYLRDRLLISRELLSETGSIFVQIGEENVHRVRALLDEVFGAENCVLQISYRTSAPLGSKFVPVITDSVVWYAKDLSRVKFRRLFTTKDTGEDSGFNHVELPGGVTRRRTAADVESPDCRAFGNITIVAAGPNLNTIFPVEFMGRSFSPTGGRGWKTTPKGMESLSKAGRLFATSAVLRFKVFAADFPYKQLTNIWSDLGGASDKVYVVQTNETVVQRCLLMSSDPGDLVLDPTCGSGTTAFVAEQWGRRWITIDTSRVALALARARIMGARYPYYLLTDSDEGQRKEAEIARRSPNTQATYGDIRRGFVYERVLHITLGSIANNAEIDIIWHKWQTTLEPLRASLNASLKTSWEEWDVPREANPAWSDAAIQAHADWWKARIDRQKEIDNSVAARADFEYLYDRPFEAKKTARVAGPFTVESLSPHRVLGVGVDDELLDPAVEATSAASESRSFVEVMLGNLKISGVQQAHKADKIVFNSLTPWPGDYVCAEGFYLETDGENAADRRAAIFIGPEFGTVLKADITAAAREAADAGFDVLITCAFAYEAYASELVKIGRLQILKARMNADLHMAEDLKQTEKANLFVIFGEPDIDVIEDPDDKVRVKINGVDVFHPATGEVRSDGPDGIACWFVDTDYNEESFFVRHAYFLGANDPYDALRKTLRADIDEEAWRSLHSDVSRAFEKPRSGRIAVKVINHLGDEVMKVFKVSA